MKRWTLTPLQLWDTPNANSWEKCLRPPRAGLRHRGALCQRMRGSSRAGPRGRGPGAGENSRGLDVFSSGGESVH
jgi:hypothetical protein